jgi:hypothetical protein
MNQPALIDNDDAMLAVRSLPFVSDMPDDDFKFWFVETSGHQATDIEQGENYARIAIEIARIFDMPLLIAMVLRDMTLAGKFTGIEAGFLMTVSSAARAGSMN